MSDHRENEREPAGIEPASPQPVTELVQYAEGSIVSRTIVDREQGTVTLFAFDTGQGLSEHTTPFDAFVLVLDGVAELVIGGQTVNATAGEMVLMPASVPHAVRADRRFKMMLIMLRG